MGGFWFVRFSCIIWGMDILILVTRRFRLLNISNTTNFPFRLRRCPIQTPKWHAVSDFLLFIALSSLAGRTKRRNRAKNTDITDEIPHKKIS